VRDSNLCRALADVAPVTICVLGLLSTCQFLTPYRAASTRLRGVWQRITFTKECSVAGGKTLAHDASKAHGKDYIIEPPDAGARFAERRCAPRFPFVAAAEVFDPVSRTSFQGRTAEIAAKGCYVEMLRPLPVNSVFQLRISRDTRTFETWGRAAYTQTGLGMGVAFLKTSPEQVKLIESWIAELSSA
jgi:PilZ domain